MMTSKSPFEINWPLVSNLDSRKESGQKIVKMLRSQNSTNLNTTAVLNSQRLESLICSTQPATSITTSDEFEPSWLEADLELKNFQLGSWPFYLQLENWKSCKRAEISMFHNSDFLIFFIFPMHFHKNWYFVHFIFGFCVTKKCFIGE